MVFKCVVSTADARNSDVISIMHSTWEGINEAQDEDRLSIYYLFLIYSSNVANVYLNVLLGELFYFFFVGKN